MEYISLMLADNYLKMQEYLMEISVVNVENCGQFNKSSSPVRMKKTFW